MSAKVNLELYRLRLIEMREEAKLRKEAGKVIEKKLKEMKTSSLSKDETKKVNKKLVEIQLNLLEEANNKLKVLIKDFGKFSSYKEKGDFKFNFLLDHKLV
jgi:hypothetical protein